MADDFTAAEEREEWMDAEEKPEKRGMDHGASALMFLGYVREIGNCEN